MLTILASGLYGRLAPAVVVMRLGRCALALAAAARGEVRRCMLLHGARVFSGLAIHVTVRTRAESTSRMRGAVWGSEWRSLMSIASMHVVSMASIQ